MIRNPSRSNQILKKFSHLKKNFLPFEKGSYLSILYLWMIVNQNKEREVDRERERETSDRETEKEKEIIWLKTCFGLELKNFVANKYY